MTPVRKFKSGYDHAENKFTERASVANRPFVPRFFLKKGQTAKIVFLDDEPVMVEEHVIQERKPGGGIRYKNITSPATFGEEDPLKDEGSRTSYVAYYTIVDLTDVYTDKNGKKHANQKKLIGLKSAGFDTVKRRRAAIVKKAEAAGKKRTLKLAVFSVTRGMDDKSPNTGSDWEYEGHMKASELLADIEQSRLANDPPASLDPLDYEEVLAPPADDELAMLARRYRAAAAAEDQKASAPTRTPTRSVSRLDDDDDEETVSDDDDGDDEAPGPMPKKKKAAVASKSTKKAAVVAKKKKAPVEEEDDEELFDDDADAGSDDDDDTDFED